jgi:hypothetical protein
MNRLPRLLTASIAAITITTNPCTAQVDAPSADEVKAIAGDA